MTAKSYYTDANDRLDFMRYLVWMSGLTTTDYAATYDEISEELGISKQAVEQIEKRALFKLREKFKHIFFSKEFDTEVGFEGKTQEKMVTNGDGYAYRYIREPQESSIKISRRIKTGSFSAVDQAQGNVDGVGQEHQEVDTA